jgi:biotin carboxylase
VSNNRKILGVVGHNYLRETGLQQLQQDFDIAIFAKPSSALHRIANYSCPILSIDLPDRAFMQAVKLAEQRGIRCDGFLSIRDWNVCGAAKAAALLKNPPPRATAISDLERLRQKSRVRGLLNRAIDPCFHTPVEFKVVPQRISDSEFVSLVGRFLREGSAILKPDRGSCSYYIVRLDNRKQIGGALRVFRAAANFRGGTFILERLIEGSEFPVDSVVSDQVRSVHVAEYLPRVAGKFFERGIIVPARLDQTRLESIHTLSRLVHECLGVRNMVTHIEVIIPPKGPPAVVEVNPRMAGDLMQELYRLVYGVQFYRIAGHLALGLSIPSSLTKPSAATHGNALIMFSEPRGGVLRLAADPGRFLRHSDERFGCVFPEDSVLTDVDNNDERPAYVLTVGASRAEVIRRAEAALRSCTPP